MINQINPKYTIPIKIGISFVKIIWLFDYLIKVILKWQIIILNALEINKYGKKKKIMA